MRHRWWLAVAALLVATAVVACDGDAGDAPETTPTEDAATAAAPPTVNAPQTIASTTPATFRIIAGKHEGNRDVEAFMPADVRIRAGDTIEWTATGYEGHTVTFGPADDTLASIGPYLLPNPADPEEMIFNPTLSLRSEYQGLHDGTDAFINSGFFGIPVEQTYSLTFEEEGLYIYLCLVHPFTMTGTISVEPPGTEVESPDSVAARGEQELTAYMQELRDEARRVGDEMQSAQGPAGETIHYVQVGAITDHGQVAVYLPGALDIAVGDTVIFQNDDRNFHNVIFKGAGELPQGIGIIPGPDGLNFSLSKQSAVAVDPPPEGFDETTFLSSGSMGVTQPRITWTVRFTTPGTYVYACTIHTLAGMTGVIEVHEAGEP
jgi:plastocyanin